ncbi:16S rRNA (uracil(1498)-N(3))-methyltransferase [Lachnobacterium bovis]|uniref:Ribosomal RNA small subunit methyltransferase E n=1 Tax=Lachnobacterium bovis TaxID=140626 RepID=A0A1H9RFL3_9FIRM|nr:16S rRNA (uracil(1498)-N(3))-methyltransferase [Lachnobacterium bovis]SER71508.1 16S rRNA (uracil1498-N3)-methyltransferase [Lachnobacterium bovis]
MQQFFVEQSSINGNKIILDENDINHVVNVLRMKVGEKIRVSDNKNVSYYCHLVEISKEMVAAEIDEVDEVGTELYNEIYLFQGLPKGDKMELVIQKAVELGATKVIPTSMKNCVVKLDDKKAKNKQKRWQTIAESAAKQAKRTIIPEVTMPMKYKDAMKFASTLDVVLLPYENQRGMEATREIIGKIKRGAKIGIFVGPEGGFAGDEITNLPGNVSLISLGRRILRTETAGLATLSMLVFCLDD